jgi:hypothetical protein
MKIKEINLQSFAEFLCLDNAFHTLLTPTIAKNETILHYCKSKLSFIQPLLKKKTTGNVQRRRQNA